MLQSHSRIAACLLLQADGEAAQSGEPDAEGNMGISSPLYKIIDTWACLSFDAYDLIPLQGDGDAAQSSGLDAEENMGISSPLYQIIDVVFDLRARGFLRRQVCPCLACAAKCPLLLIM